MHSHEKTFLMLTHEDMELLLLNLGHLQRDMPVLDGGLVGGPAKSAEMRERELDSARFSLHLIKRIIQLNKERALSLLLCTVDFFLDFCFAWSKKGP